MTSRGEAAATGRAIQHGQNNSTGIIRKSGYGKDALQQLFGTLLALGSFIAFAWLERRLEPRCLHGLTIPFWRAVGGDSVAGGKSC